MITPLSSTPSKDNFSQLFIFSNNFRALKAFWSAKILFLFVNTKPFAEKIIKTIKGSLGSISEAPFFFAYAPTQLVAPRAVSTAEMIEARICSVHFSVSFLLISLQFFKIIFNTETQSYRVFSILILRIESAHAWHSSSKLGSALA